MKTTIFLTIAALAAALTGCSKHDDDKKPDAWNGEIRLTSGITTQTRAGSADVPDRQIAAGKNVLFYVDDAGASVVKKNLYENYAMTTDGNGGFTKYNQQAEDMYYPATGNGVDIYALLTNGFMGGPAFPTSAITHKVESDQSVQHGDNYLASDLLYAAQKGVTRTPYAVQMNFYHLLSKVEVALKAGAGMTSNDLTGAVVTIENTRLKADFLPDKTKEINGTAAEAQAARASLVTLTAADNDVASILIGTAVSDDFSAYASAVVVPQTVAQNKRFIKVKLQSGVEFYYTLPKALTMESGKIYDFTITLNLTGLTVTSTVTDWATGAPIEGTSELPPPIGSKDPATAAVGDFYFSDGTLAEKDATLTDAQKAACVGVVYWVGDPTNGTDDDPLLATQHPGCTHGLVVALHETKDPSGAATMKWSAESEQVNDWTNYGDRGADKVDITAENKMQGYANTIALKAYNAQQANANLKVLPIAAIEQYSTDHPAPANSSGWYLPSSMELKYICWGQGNGESTIGRDLLNGQFAKAGGTQLSGVYWSSSEDQGYPGNAWRVYFGYGDVDTGNKGNGYRVRAVSAF